MVLGADSSGESVTGMRSDARNSVLDARQSRRTGRGSRRLHRQRSLKRAYGERAIRGEDRLSFVRKLDGVRHVEYVRRSNPILIINIGLGADVVEEYG